VSAGTHIAFATTRYRGGAALFEYQPDLLGWGLAAAAALLPAIDLPTAKRGRALFWLSTRLERRFGHRTRTHALLALVVLGVVAAPIYLWWKPVSVVGGYWSHLWIDMVNLRGADLLWPSPVRLVMPGKQAVSDGGREQGRDGPVGVPVRHCLVALSGERDWLPSRPGESAGVLRHGARDLHQERWPALVSPTDGGDR